MAADKKPKSNTGFEPSQLVEYAIALPLAPPPWPSLQIFEFVFGASSYKMKFEEQSDVIQSRVGAAVPRSGAGI